jgi:hypothetical protein
MNFLDELSALMMCLKDPRRIDLQELSCNCELGEFQVPRDDSSLTQGILGRLVRGYLHTNRLAD